MRTMWDVLTSVGRDVQVLFPTRPSQAFIELPNDWQLSISVCPSSASTLGRQFALRLESPICGLDAQGRRGSPEGWFDLTIDAEVAILRPDGTWYHCQTHPLPTDP